MIIYNTVTWVCTILVIAMLVFSVVVFKHAAPGQPSANLPGRDYEMKTSRGLSTGEGLKQKEFK